MGSESQSKADQERKFSKKYKEYSLNTNTGKSHHSRGSKSSVPQSMKGGKGELQDPSMHLVPCRWSRSGWKYVEVDPKEAGFFNNPNRVNSFGMSPQGKKDAKGVKGAGY